MATKFMTLDNIGKERKIKNSTIFKYTVGNDNGIPKITTTTLRPNSFNNLLFIGYDSAMDLHVFKAWDDDEEDSHIIFYGIKGDEFD